MVRNTDIKLVMLWIGMDHIQSNLVNTNTFGPSVGVRINEVLLYFGLSN